MLHSAFISSVSILLLQYCADFEAKGGEMALPAFGFPFPKAKAAEFRLPYVCVKR